MKLPLILDYEIYDEDGPCAPYFTGRITDVDGRVMCNAESEERAVELVDHVAALLARHNALAEDHKVSLMLLAREREQRDALLRLRDTDEWRSGVAIGGYIVAKVVAERELEAIKKRHNALREAVEWERDAMDERVTESIYSHYMRTIPAALHDLACLRDCARAEVDRLIANESAADCEGEG